MSSRVHPEGEPIHNTKQPSLMWSKTIATLNWLKSKIPVVFSSSRYEHICEKCSHILDDRRFDLCLTFVIICSSIALALDDPLRNPKSSTAGVLFILNYVFTAIFIVEFLVKILSQGLCKYLQDRWNILDFSCVVASILELLSVQGGKTKLYELDTTSCSAINDSLGANFEQEDQECTEGKQQYFGQCCDVSSVIVSQPSSGSMVPASSPSGQTLNNPTQPTSWGQAPSGNFTWIPSGGQVHFVSTGIIFGLSFIFFIFV